MPFSVFNAAGAALNQSLTDTPVGSIQPFAGASAPGGWLLCDGAAVSRTDYAELFAVLGTTYGTGNGSTTFNVPDLRGRVPAGLDNMGGNAASRLTNTVLSASNTLGATGGAQTHTLTTAQLPSHNHAPKGDGTSFYVGVPTGGDVINGGGASYRFNFGTNYTTTGNTGSDNAHTNTQPTLVVNYIILASSLATRLQAAALPQYVTSLPSSPVDGQTVVYAADASNGVMWTLRYRAASSSSYKWEVVGGSGLLGYDSTTTGRTVSFGTGTWGSWSSTVSVTPPLAGEYVAEHQARVYLNGSAGAMAVGLGKTPSGGSLTEATLDDLTTGIAGISTYSVSVRAQGFLSLSAANTAVSQRYWHNAGTTVTAYRYQASIRLLPVRVG